MSRIWRPNQLERKCLEHLDAPGAWEILKAERPSEDEILSWRPFRRIFAFNFVLFGVLLTALFLGLEVASGTLPADIRQDLPWGLAIVAGIAIGFGLYVTHLYRRSWNGRARSLKQTDDGREI